MSTSTMCNRDSHKIIYQPYLVHPNTTGSVVVKKTVVIAHENSPSDECYLVWSELFPKHLLTPRHLIRVIWCGREIREGDTFGYYNIQHGSVLHLVPRMDPEFECGALADVDE